MRPGCCITDASNRTICNFISVLHQWYRSHFLFWLRAVLQWVLDNWRHLTTLSLGQLILFLDLPTKVTEGKILDPLADQGPMLWFFKYFRRTIQRKNWRFRLKTKLNYAKFLSSHWFLRKTPIFCRKLSKIAENCDYNIDPSFLKQDHNWGLKSNMGMLRR
jgi:hypothetical protein